MKYAIGLAVLVLSFGVALSAQDDAAYIEWMKATGAANGSLRKNMEAKAADGVAADAKKLSEIFGQVRVYWEKKNVADAAKFSADAESGFKEVAELASAGKLDEASVALKTAAATCAGCHDAHREKAADGSWKIK